MKRKAWFLIPFAIVASIFVGCNDDLSSVGESIQPNDDKVNARMDSIDLDYSTVLLSSVYSNSSFSLLGEISDPVYGDFKGNFITSVRTARNFKFHETPLDNKVDSVFLDLRIGTYSGDTTAMLKAAAYKVDAKLPDTGLSQTDLDKYIQPANLLGNKTYSVATSNLDSITKARFVRIPLDKSLGQKIYEYTSSHPEYFDTQESFEKNVLGKMLFTTTTGTGSVLRIYGVDLSIYYTIKREKVSADGKKEEVKVPVREIFVNTKEQMHIQGFKNEDIESLLKPNDKYSFVKSPAGVVTKVVWTKERLQKVFSNHKTSTWVINEAQYRVNVEPPKAKSVINPAPYMLCIVADSVDNFFKNHETEYTRPNSAFLSNSYNINYRTYSFSNISPMIAEHIKKHGKDNGAGKYEIKEDLVAYLIPVERAFLSESGSGSKTTDISNFLFPSAAQILKKDVGARMGIVTTEYHKQSDK